VQRLIIYRQFKKHAYVIASHMFDVYHATISAEPVDYVKY
jgi:hypothetical protein